MTVEEELQQFIGKKIVHIEVREEYSSKLKFEFEDGYGFSLYHGQDCCEDVRIIDIVGDLKDLEGEILVKALEETTEDDSRYEAIKMTQYTFRTNKSTVTVLWRGESNGWYSVSVDIQTFGPEDE